MAIYQYKCKECGDFDVHHKMGEAPASERCPVCGKAGAKRVFAAVRIAFKGSGFYSTDSRASKSDG